jgi:hypothetical protein
LFFRDEDRRTHFIDDDMRISINSSHAFPKQMIERSSSRLRLENFIHQR